MAQQGANKQNTAYGVFVQACWAQHKRQYPDELIDKEIEEFNKQCSVWWYNLSEQERDRFQEMADRSNAQQALQQSYTTQVNNANTLHANSGLVQNTVSSTSAGGIPSFGSSFTYSDYGAQGAGGQVINAVVNQTGTVLNYSTNAAAPGQMVQQRTVMGQVQQRPGQQVVQQPGKGGKPMKDPNAPKKPLSAYFLYSQEERLKVKAQFPDYSITEIAKELGRRWATINPAIKQSYEQRYQESRRQYEQALQAYNPQKKKKDPNAPKQPLSAYFLFSQEERLKVKAEHPSYSICEIAKELGRRWADMPAEVKQHYQQKAEEGRQKYDQDMAVYRQDNSDETKPKRDPNLPKQPLSAYFLYSQDERLKVKAEHPAYSICEIAKELGRRWAVMTPEVKQRYQQMAEQGRQKYDQDMAAYRQANPRTPLTVATQETNNGNQNQASSVGASTSKITGSVPTTVPQTAAVNYAAISGNDYSSFLLQ